MAFALALGAFLAEAVVISLSGVMAPGPITAVAVGQGGRSPRAGIWVAIGHGIVELPLTVGVYLGVGRLLGLPYVRPSIALAGGAVLLWMGLGMLRALKQGAVVAQSESRSPLVAGIVLSLGSPYFLIWWATVGAALISRSTEFGVIGFVLFALAHWLCDLVWDTILSVLAYRGGQFFGKRFQVAVFAVCGGALLFFGGRLMLEGARELGVL